MRVCKCDEFGAASPRGPVIGYFQENAPADAAGKREFRKGGFALRTGDSSRALKKEEAAAHQTSLGLASDSPFAIDIPYFQVLAFETHEFVPHERAGSRAVCSR